MTTYTLHLGNNCDTLKNYPDNHFDSIVTDPPYGIEFLGKDWDSNTGAIETWEQCLRVLKPGGHLLAFSAARTYHHLATNIEAVGFEIRDQIMWIYGSGFPKAQDVGKNIDKRGQDNEWAGWKTALKPAHEPIVMARKPMKGSTVDNVLEHGTGALNIDATRIPSDTLTYPSDGINRMEFNQAQPELWQGGTTTNALGRYPSNVIGEIPDYQKYFYCPKVSRSERHTGFESAHTEKEVADRGIKGDFYSNNIADYGHNKKANPLAHIPTDSRGRISDDGIMKHHDPNTGNMLPVGNNHPTVKPVALMNYLVTLVTPPGGKVLDPFMGSGSTGMAVVEFGGEFTGCELDPDYVAIAEKRIAAWLDKHQPLSKYETDLTATADQ